MIIYPQKPTILAQKRSFTPNFFEFQHFFVHRPLKTSNACIEKFIYPAAPSILASKSPKPPWNVWFSGFFLHSPFEIIALPAMTVWSRWIASLCSQWPVWSQWIATFHSQWRVWSTRITTLRSKWQRKKDQIFVFYKRKAVKDHVNS